jgi:hypothetical protein
LSRRTSTIPTLTSVFFMSNAAGEHQPIFASSLLLPTNADKRDWPAGRMFLALRDRVVKSWKRNLQPYRVYATAS